MADLQIEIKGEAGNISIPTFLTVLDETFEVLKELDSAVSQRQDGSLEWVVKNLRVGSLVVEIESRSKLEEDNFGPRVANAFVTSFYQIEHYANRPPYLTDTAIRRMKRMLGTIGKDGASGLSVSYADTKIEITAQAMVNVRRLLKVRYRSIASIEGKLIMISLRGEPHFSVQDEQTQRSVTCKIGIEEGLLEKAKDALGRRVSISGLLSYNIKGEPLSMRAEYIRILKRRSELPTISELAGSDPEFTGAMTTEEYIRSLRVG